MKSLRKLLVAAIVTAMVLGTVGSAFAAVRAPNMVFTDIEGHPRASYILRTAALGIFAGYPVEDGKFEYRPDQVVSRAEFAAVVVRILGRSDAARIMAGTPTQFPDVPTTHWASGYINVSTALGIIRGYPDGTFDPNGQVTMAEGITMIIRAMGYSPMAEATASWPTGEILTASSMPTDKTNVSILVSQFVAADGCNRADVAEMVYKALPVLFLTGKDANNQWTYSDETLMKKVGGQKIASEIVKYTVQDGKTWLIIPSESDPVEIAADAILVGAENFADLNERKVTFIKKADKIIFAELLPDTTLVRGDYTAFTSPNKVTVNGAVYEFAATYTLRRNSSTMTEMADVFLPLSQEDFFKLTPKPAATLILDAAGKVTVMDIFVFNVEGMISNKITQFIDDKIVNSIVVGATTYEITSGASIVRNGQTATFADLKLGDQVKVALDGDGKVVAVDAINVVVEGYVTQASYDMASGMGMIMLDADKAIYMPTVGSATYERWEQIFGSDLLLQGAKDTTVPTTISSLTVASVRLGDRMEVTLDRNGRAFAMKAWERTVMGNVTAKSTTANKLTIDGTEYSVVTVGGDVFSFDGKLWSAEVFLSAVPVGTPVKVALNQAGAIRTAAVPVLLGEVIGTIDTTAKTITVKGSVGDQNVTYSLTDDFKVMEGGVQVSVGNVTDGMTVRLTFANNKVSVVTLAGTEYVTIENKRVYIEGGVIVQDIVLSDGRTVVVNNVTAYTLNGEGFDTVTDGFNAMAIKDAAVITYDVQGKAVGIDLFRAVPGKIATIGAEVVLNGTTLLPIQVVHPTSEWPISGWDGRATGFTVWVQVDGTGATALTRNGRTVGSTALRPDDMITFAWKATATPDNPRLNTLVAKNLPLDGTVVGKTVTFENGTMVTMLQINDGTDVIDVPVAANAIVIKDGVPSTVENINVGDKIKCNFGDDQAPVGKADYFEVTTP